MHRMPRIPIRRSQCIRSNHSKDALDGHRKAGWPGHPRCGGCPGRCGRRQIRVSKGEAQRKGKGTEFIRKGRGEGKGEETRGRVPKGSNKAQEEPSEPQDVPEEPQDGPSRSQEGVENQQERVRTGTIKNGVRKKMTA